MADKTITCQNCGNIITVSEFASAKSLTCVNCKREVPITGVGPAPRVPHEKLRIAPPQASEPGTGTKGSTGTQTQSRPNDVQRYLPKGKGRTKRRRMTTFQARLLPWLVFIVLAAALAWARYWPAALSPETLSLAIRAGVWALLLLHFSVVCYAFTDDAFYGILSLIIPGYSLYYLFVQSDKMILRALVAALLIAFGWDALLAANQRSIDLYTTISRWIATTESIKK
jgi:hypothetical protein